MAKQAPEHESYTDAMDEMVKQHNARIEEMQRAMEQRIRESETRVAQLLEESVMIAEEAVKKEEKGQEPQAMWSVIDGERLLVLNEAAASQHEAMLDTIVDVLGELKTVLKP